MRYANIILVFLIVVMTAGIYNMSVNAQEPDDYAFVIPLDFENLSGTDINHLMPIEVNAQALLDLGVISTTTDDFLWTDPNEVQVPGFAQDLNDNGVNWWSHVIVPDGQSTTNLLFVGGPEVDDGFPVNHPDYNDAHIEVPDSASLDIINDLDLTVELEADSSDQLCGTIAEKSNLNTLGSNRTGYAMYSAGNRASSSNWTLASSANSQRYYFDFTPDFDMHVCGMWAYNQGTANSNHLPSSVRVISGDLNADEASETITVFPLYTYPTFGVGLGWLYFDKSVFLEGGITHRFLFDCTFSASCTAHNITGLSDTQSSAIGDFSLSGNITHSIYGAYNGVPTNQQANSGLAYYDATSPDATFISVVDDKHRQGSASLTNWDGTKAIFRMTYSTPTLDMFFNGINVGSQSMGVGTLDTNANNLVIGKNFNGNIHSVQLDSGVSTVLDIPSFTPSRINEFQEGTTPNNWLWKGTITDDSASSNDAVYFITADTTNVNISAGALALQPTPTPAVTPEVLSGILAGGSVAGFHTPVPTVEAELPGTVDPPDPGEMQSEVFYIIMGIYMLTILASVAGRFMSEYAMAVVIIGGFGVISGYAGEDFQLWLVALIGLGSTGMALILHQGR